MAKISAYYYLKNPEAVRHSVIMVQLSCRDMRIRFSTGLSLPVREWVEKKQKSKLKAINNRLREIDEAIETYSNECELIGRDPDLDALKKIIKGDYKSSGQKTFVEYIQMYYDYNKQNKANNTIRKYLTLKNYFEKYHPDVTLYDIDGKLAAEILKRSLELKELNNTISKRFQLIRVVANWCIDMKYINNIDLKNFTYKQDEKSDQIYLTQDEINQLMQLDLTGNKVKDFLRDIFVVACNTGVDFCDLHQLNKANLKKTEKGNRYFKFIRKKTEKEDIYSYPPCTDLVYSLLSKWNWDTQALMLSCDKSRHHLKDIAKRAGITYPKTLVRKSGNEVIRVTKPKYEWIQWKTARRSFITNKLDDRVLTELVSNAVGHKKTATTAKYQHAEPAHLVDLLMESKNTSTDQ